MKRFHIPRAVVFLILFILHKNRGAQLVKLYVPVLFFFCAGCGTKHSRCRAGSCRANQAAAPGKKRMEWRNWSGAFADAPVLVRRRLELSNYRCENRIPQMVSLVNPFFGTFLSSCVFSRFSTFCPKNGLCAGRKPTYYLLQFGVVLVTIKAQDFVDRFSSSSTACSRELSGRAGVPAVPAAQADPPPESRQQRAVFQRLNS